MLSWRRDWRRAAIDEGRGAAGNDHDPEVLVRVTTTDVEALKRFLQSNRFEVLRVMLPARGDPDAVATLLMRRSDGERALLVAAFKVEILAGPPWSDADIPEVGRGNRFANPGVLPAGGGRLVRRPS